MCECGVCVRGCDAVALGHSRLAQKSDGAGVTAGRPHTGGTGLAVMPSRGGQAPWRTCHRSSTAMQMIVPSLKMSVLSKKLSV